MSIASATSPEAKIISEGLSGPDQVAVMGAIIGKLREADWTDKVSGVHGAVILADASPEARKDLHAFISTLSTKSMNKGLLFLLRKKGYLESK